MFKLSLLAAFLPTAAVAAVESEAGIIVQVGASNVSAVAVGFWLRGALKATEARLTEEIKGQRAEIAAVRHTAQTNSEDIAHIEGHLDRRGFARPGASA